MKYFNSIKQSEIFEGISPEEIKVLLNHMNYSVKSYKRNEYIISEGDKINSIALVLNGTVIVSKNDYWGNQSILLKLKESDHFGESVAVTHKKATVDAIAATDAEVMFIPIDRIMAICSKACSFHLKLMNNLMNLIAEKNIALTGKINHMAKRSTKDKLMSYLLDFSKSANSKAFDIPFNRQQLADYLSVDRSAMSNELCKLRDEGILKFNKNHFEIF